MGVAASTSRIDAALLLLRVAGGGFLLPHGLGKLVGAFGGPGLAGFADELVQFGLPAAAPIPLLLALVQTLSGLAVLLGVWTRGSAAVAACFIATTVWIAAPHGWFWMRTGLEYPLMWLIVLLALVLLGGGRWSLVSTRPRDAGAAS